MHHKNALHLDVRAEMPVVAERLQALQKSMQDLALGQGRELLHRMKLPLTCASPEVTSLKLAELLDPQSAPYRVAEFSETHTGKDSMAITRMLLPILKGTGIVGAIEKDYGVITFPTVGTVQADEHGEVIAADDARFLGKDIYHLLSCHIEQDLATVMKKGSGYVYTSDISRFEKTPKNAQGRNAFLGRDIVEFHSKAPNFGARLGKLFQTIIGAFESGDLEMLVVDLNGQNVYDVNSRPFRRFERDHFLPIPGENGECIGFIGIAEVQFQPTSETRTPYEGGDVLAGITSNIDLVRGTCKERCDAITKENPIAILQDIHVSPEKKLEIIDYILKHKDHFREEVLTQAASMNKKNFGDKLGLYGISYISDACANNCTYCGLNSEMKHKRSTLTEDEMALDFRAVIGHGSDEFCILAGEAPSQLHLLQQALKTANQVNDESGRTLETITFNVAPMSTEDFSQLVRTHTGDVALQYRIFQETYDRNQYAKYHTRGPKSDFDNRLNAQSRALEAGFDSVGIGALLGINICNEPYAHAGHNFEIRSLIAHAFRLKEQHGKFPKTVSIPRHMRSEDSDFSTPNPVDDALYIFYHALLRLALPETQLMITSRESSELIRSVEPFVNIRDLAPRPGVGGNFRHESHFQNELGDARSAEEILSDLRERGKLRRDDI